MRLAAFNTALWTQVRAHLAQNRTPEDLHEAMLVEARHMREVASKACADLGLEPGHRQFEREFWRQLGVEIVQSEMRHSGGHCENGDQRLVFVNQNEHAWRQRFTAAHEVGHLLLGLPHHGTFVKPHEEELMCEEFASELLIPRRELLQSLSPTDRPTPSLLNRLCRQFRVNLQPMLIALEGMECFKDVLAILSQRRGHPRRLQEIDYRVDRCVGQRVVFLPRHKRLRSLGLPELGEWAVSQPAGRQGTGRLPAVALPLWNPEHGRGAARGPVVWRAQTLANNAMLVFMDVSQLNYEWSQCIRRKSRTQ